MKRRVAILISGRGSNMVALIDAAKAADFPAEIVAVISNRADAGGLEKAKASKFDLVITDLNMPVMNGLELIKALRALPALMGLPIVFLTTESSEAVKLEAKKAGATGWITKPFKQDQLLAVVGKLVRS